jgi:hypothetical protein
MPNVLRRGNEPRERGRRPTRIRLKQRSLFAEHQQIVAMAQDAWVVRRPTIELCGTSQEEQMRMRFSSSCAFGLAIALTVGGVSTVNAQQADGAPPSTKSTKSKPKTGSSQRIPIKKQFDGEVVAPAPTVNQDSIAAAERARQEAIAAEARARQEAIARAEQARRDSIAAAERRKQDSLAAERARLDAIARADSIARAEMARAEAARLSYMRKHGGWYFGIGFGASVPTGDFTNAGLNSGGYGTGWNMTIPVGYDFSNSPVGIRFDIDFDQLNGKDFNSNVNASNLNAWTTNLDLRLRVPLGKTWSRFYMLGGATYSNISGWDQNFSNPNAPQDKFTFGDSNGRWGWNAGAGLNFNWGSMVGMFVESRYIAINANTVSGFPYTKAAWVPIVLGVTF